MKIKRLDIVGFKSFVERTSLEFPPGVIGVVGPNGCGKSNIVDAIRWGLGEQNARSLRGRAMEDIIFGGSEKRKPLGMAEVSITFDNEARLSPPKYHGLSEITVTRRLYRSGESEYLLNKASCRLLDIAELVMDTGVGARAYSIIEQGRIGQILSAKPEERRFLIEEAAGISKFKARKKAALRKIEATRQNLVRLGDIVSEVSRQMGGLKRQAHRAERFRQWREEMRGLELSLARQRYVALCQVVAAQSGELEQLRAGLELATASCAGSEAQLEEHRLLLAAAEKDLQRAQEQLFQLSSECQGMEQRLEFIDREQQSLATHRQHLLTEQQQLGERLAAIGAELQQLTAEAVHLAEALNLERESLSARARDLQGEDEQAREVEARLELLRRELYTCLSEVSRLDSFQGEGQRRLEGLDERQRRLRAESLSLHGHRQEAVRKTLACREQLEQQEQQHGQLLEEQADLEPLLAGAQQILQVAEAELAKRRGEHGAKSSRVDSLRELYQSLAGCGEAVRRLCADSEFMGHWQGLVADCLSAPAELELALEAALGERLQALVAVDAASVLAAREAGASQGGRVAFVLPGYAAATISCSHGQPLTALLEVQAAEDGLAARLLAGVYLVDDLDGLVGVELPLGVCLVTRDGRSLNYRGEFASGQDSGSGQGLLRQRRELDDAIVATEESLQLLDAAERESQAARQRLEGLRERQAELRQLLHERELRVLEQRKELERGAAEEARLGERLEMLAFEEEQLDDERRGVTQRLAEARQQSEERQQRQQQLESALEDLQQQLRCLRQAAAERRQQLTDVQVRVAGLEERRANCEREKRRLLQMETELQQRTRQLGVQIEEGEGRRLGLAEEQRQLELRLEVSQKRCAELREAFASQREGYEARLLQVQELESQARQLRQQADEQRKQLGAREIRLRELELERRHRREAVLERFDLDLDELVGQATDVVDEEPAETRLAELRQRIVEMGEVNLTAIEQFRELEQRHDFLVAQQQDLRQSMDDLQNAIARINRTTRARFREAFEQINGRFQEVFPRLFRGGRAELVLTDESDLLETGIEISVQPPGKRLQSVSLLSGGEKALAAVALIFAIFLVKPSPFCLLDEVDAPLDDANIDRFNEMVREMSQGSQFIIITHNKKTMEIADPLYGITMEEPGVSKLVSVRMTAVQPG